MASAIQFTEAQGRLAEQGEEIVIAREGHASMQILPLKPQTENGSRVFGQNLLGITYISPDFDDPLSEEELQDWGM